MLLKEVMKDYFKETLTVSQDFGFNIPRELPCNVKETSGWQENKSEVSRVFKFSNRDASRHFIKLIFEYEEKTGFLLNVSLTKNNEVSVDFEKFNITRQDVIKITSFANSMFLDAAESYKFE